MLLLFALMLHRFENSDRFVGIEKEYRYEYERACDLKLPSLTSFSCQLIENRPECGDLYDDVKKSFLQIAQCIHLCSIKVDIADIIGQIKIFFTKSDFDTMLYKKIST